VTKRDDLGYWTLMHKNIPVANLEMIEETGTVVKVMNVFNLKHAPVGTLNKTHIDRRGLNEWLADRAIPASRKNLNQLLRGLDIISAPALALKSYGLSLSDQYWIKPENMVIPWEDVNFFQNEFSDDIGEILFNNKDSRDSNINLKSPDNTSDGVLQKRWTIQNGKRILVKGGDDDFRQQPYNEKIASSIMLMLGIEHTHYTRTFIDDRPYSLCENFINEETELITAWRIIKSMKQRNSDSDYQHLLKSCERLGVGNMKNQLEQMMVVDYIIANTDRHYGNFGFIRNANTLEYKGFAPIYDSGTSLWHDGSDISIVAESKPFIPRHNKQIKLVTDLSWYEPIAKSQLAEIVINTLSRNPLMKEERILAVAEGVNVQADFITKLKRELSPPTISVK